MGTGPALLAWHRETPGSLPPAGRAPGVWGMAEGLPQSTKTPLSSHWWVSVSAPKTHEQHSAPRAALGAPGVQTTSPGWS